MQKLCTSENYLQSLSMDFICAFTLKITPLCICVCEVCVYACMQLHQPYIFSN